MTRPLRLLISARDPGAASHLAPIIAACSGRRDIEAVLVAASPALEYWRDLGLAPHPVDAVDADMTATARRVLDAIMPDAVLTGLSGQGRGIDEALVAMASIPHTYALQDYPGDVNPGYGKVAATFLVADQESAELTRIEAPSSRAIIVGNVKFAALAAGIDPLALRAAGRQRLAVGPQRPVVSFYGQPIDIPGYWRSLRDFTAAVAEVAPDALLLARPHPKESPEMRARTLALLGDRIDRIEDPLTIEESVCAADLAVTCFSTSINVLNYLARMSPRPLGSGLYLMFDPELVAWYHANNRPQRPPLAELAIEVRDPADLPGRVRTGLTPAEAARQWALTATTLPPPIDAAGRVLDAIVADLEAVR